MRRRRVKIRDIKHAAYNAANNANVAALKGQQLIDETSKDLHRIALKVEAVLDTVLDMAEETEKDGVLISLEPKSKVAQAILGDFQTRLRFGEEDEEEEP